MKSIEEIKRINSKYIERIKEIFSKEMTGEQIAQDKAQSITDRQELLTLAKEREKRETGIVRQLVEQGYPENIALRSIDDPEIIAFFDLEILRNEYNIPECMPYEPKTGRLRLST